MACENYRGISLLNTSYKIFTSIVKKRLEPHVEGILGESRPASEEVDRLMTNYIFVVKRIAEKFWEYNIDFYHVFVDFK